MRTSVSACMHVSVLACMHISVSGCGHISIVACMRSYKYACIRLLLFMQTFAYKYACMHKLTSTHAHIFRSLRACILVVDICSGRPAQLSLYACSRCSSITVIV